MKSGLVSMFSRWFTHADILKATDVLCPEIMYPRHSIFYLNFHILSQIPYFTNNQITAPFYRPLRGDNDLVREKIRQILAVWQYRAKVSVKFQSYIIYFVPIFNLLLPPFSRPAEHPQPPICNGFKCAFKHEPVIISDA
jgi:hypothetical protein